MHIFSVLSSFFHLFFKARSEKNNATKLKHNESMVEYTSSHEQAEAAWIQHKDLNNSIIVSSFQVILFILLFYYLLL